MGVNETLTDIKGILTELKSAVDTMNDTLTTIAGQLGAPPTPPQYTIDDIFGQLSTIIGYSSNLPTIRNNTDGVEGLLTTIRNNSTDIKEYTGNVQDSLYYGLRNLGLSINTDTLNYADNSFLFEALNWLGLLSGATGLPVQSGNRTVIQLLALLLDRPTVGEVTGGLFPNDLCEAYYASTGMVIAPYGVTQIFESTIWAEFSIPPPVGIEFGSLFNLGLSSDTTELVTLEDNWNGWRFYVASSSSNYGIHIGADLAAFRRYPSNVWQKFENLETNLAFFVPASESIKVFMCRGDGSGSSSGGPWGGGSSGGGTWEPNCYEQSSQPVGVDPAHGYSPRQMAIIDAYPLISSIVWNGGFANMSIPAIHSGNFAGYVFTSISGRVRIVYGVNGSVIQSAFIDTGQTYTMPSGYNYFCLDDATGVADQQGTGAFTVQVCAPQ